MASAGIDATVIARIKEGFDGLSTKNVGRDKLVGRMIQSVSLEFERYMHRYLLQAERTVYRDIEDGQQEFFLRGIPISEVVAYFDPDRLYVDAMDADSVLITQPDHDSVVIVDYRLSPGRSYMKFVYTGGLATTTNDITAVLSGVTGTFAAGEELKVGSKMVGKVVSWDAAGLVLAWTPVVTCADADQGDTEVADVLESGANSGTIASYSTANLLSDFPDIARAAELQVFHEFTARNHPGFTSVTVMGETSSKQDDKERLIPSVRAMLSPYVLPLIGL